MNRRNVLENSSMLLSESAVGAAGGAALNDIELGAFNINFNQIDMIEVQFLSHGIESKSVFARDYCHPLAAT